MNKTITESYCNDYFNRSRFETIKVKVGNTSIGGDSSIRVQSMTTADTKDTEKSVSESVRMIDAGCELVRLTAPSKKDAENLAVIKQKLVERGYNTPLVADIHFTPNAALIAAKHIEKVRVYIHFLHKCNTKQHKMYFIYYICVCVLW